MKATELLERQHREVKGLFKELTSAPTGHRRELLRQIEEKLQTHMTIEESIFYPALGEQGARRADELVPKAYEEHSVVKLVLGTLPDVDPEAERFDAKMTVLEELIDHHVEEEEKEMFEIAEQLGTDTLEELGARMHAAAARGAVVDSGRKDQAAGDEDAQHLEVGKPSSGQRRASAAELLSRTIGRWYASR